MYFNARCKIHLKQYIKTRNDNNPALFVSLKRPYERLGINGVEARLKNIGKNQTYHTFIHTNSEEHSQHKQ